MNETTLHPILQAVQQLTVGLSKVLGDRCEVVLHDLSHPESSIIAAEGHVTFRRIGGPTTNYVLQALKQYGNDAKDYIHYRNISQDGKILRSTTLYIRDENGVIIGCLCINEDLTDYLSAQRLMDEHCRFEADVYDPSFHSSGAEKFASDINEVVDDIVRAQIQTIQKPVAAMKKEDKMSVVAKLESSGVFEVKGAVNLVSQHLSVTPFTIYNYLKEIKNTQKR